jgi:VEFS-Box of polycomb protein
MQPATHAAPEAANEFQYVKTSAKAPAGSFSDSMEGVTSVSRRPFLLRNLSNFPNRMDYLNLFWLPRSTSDNRRCVLRVNMVKLAVLKEHVHLLTGCKTADSGIVVNVALKLSMTDATGRQTAFTSASRESLLRVLDDSNRNPPGDSEDGMAGSSRESSSSSGALTLDLTAILMFLRRFPKKISLGLLISHRQSTSGRTICLRPGAQLIAKTTVFDAETQGSSWIAKGPIKAQLALKGFRLDSKPASLSASSPPPTEDTITALADSNQSNPELQMQVHKSAKPLAVGTADLFVHGGPDWTNIADCEASSRSKDVHVLVSYSSTDMPWWDGVDRHDFVCPWCHLSTKRLRSLLVHLQVDHLNPRFTMDGPPGDNVFRDPSMTSRLEVQLNIQVQKISVAPQGLDGLGEEPRTPLHQVRRGQPGEADTRTPASGSSLTLNQMPCVVKTSNMEPVAPSDIEIRPSTEPDPVMASCVYCAREYLHSSESMGSGSSCCGEWCFLMEQARKRETEPSGDRPPLVEFASPNRGKTLDFKNSFGDHALYHVKSFARFHESHFDENDADSEDEVDHSWRLTMQEEDVMALPVSSKHKVLWTMWNRHVFENGSCGSYGYQFTRYEVEMFAVEMRRDILRLGLRLIFVAFLRALHVHGQIDAEAVISALQCLDHRKMRRSCNDSRRPRKTSVISNV